MNATLLLTGIFTLALLVIVELTRVAVSSIFHEEKVWDMNARRAVKVIFAVTWSCIASITATIAAVEILKRNPSGDCAAAAMILSIFLAWLAELLIAILIRKSPWTRFVLASMRGNG